MDDVKIVGLYFERSEEALTETATKYGRLLYRVAIRILSSHEDAEECVNETFLRVWDSIPPQRPTKLTAFLAKITRNLALDRLARLKSEKRGGGAVTAELSDAIPDTVGEELSDALALKLALNGFLRALSLRDRKLFLGRYWYCYEIRELAACYRLSESNVKVILHRTRLALKAHLEAEGIVL